MLISRASKPHSTAAAAGSSRGTSDKAEAPKPQVTGACRDQDHHDRGGDVQECEDLGEGVIDSMDSVHGGENISLPAGASGGTSGLSIWSD